MLKAGPLVPSAEGRSSLQAHPENNLPATKNENEEAKAKVEGVEGPCSLRLSLFGLEQEPK